ncbi:methionine/alanine import family NSS transporter small subunit [Enemella evansiae]|uniref:Methionine/alanine import family NSS transporter small subunit n=1 Tax=Enemella evansiae TaxID=2016499 RepID=A0A255GJY5_9ACTN|nr:methionine/alanine import family NSS transporter small subunit [Enemella evansiae]OYN98661.1 hypothetical protein CGZ95_12100 [Enemella evansiae]OYN98849.1 hypothetical protein CGZ97_20935 [Enemella evansiae]OYO03261.1 hypothetical protein CGZ96_01160 [Enemella evansiae]OYO13926.1 hypothetical protein CGZ98_04900 [Enemella evansiae]OYO16158.1 hypothetical protein CGZ94_05435 [Enemella evansiae]
MTPIAIAMMVLAIVVLWGGLAAAVFNLWRHGRATR